MKLHIFFLIALSLFGANAKATPEHEFWHWFQKNENRLYAFEINREPIFDELSLQMGKVDPNLTFEFGPVMPNGKRDFVVSAGGIKSAFPAVERLVSKAPQLQRWQIIKFRPRRLPLHDIEYEGTRVKVENVRYLLVKDGDKAGIVLLMNGYTAEQHTTYGSIGYLFLDEALGEFTVETKIGFIEFQGFDSKYLTQSSPIAALSTQVDEYFSEQIRSGYYAP